MTRWKNLWRSRSADLELDAELRFHVERRVQHYMDEGLSADQARRRAQIEFGPLDLAKEECRDVRPLRWLHELVRDVRLGFRTLGRDRFFAAAVTIILALGIGTSVAMFSVLNAIVLRPLPYSRPGELARLTTHLIDRNQPDGTSLPNVLDWRQQSASFAGMTFHRRTSASAVTFAGIDAPQRAQEGLVGPEFFDLLGTPPLVGRTFSRAEFDGAEPVVVLSEGLWQDQFGGSEAALGRTLSIDGRNHTVIGVMPRRFQLPTRDTRFWRPLSLVSWWAIVGPARASDGLEVIGRLAPGVPLEDARAELGVIAARLREAHASNRNIDVRITPLIDHVVGGRSQRGVWIGFAAVMSLLAIACANAGGLLAARAVQKRREIAVRAALGAGRARLIRHLLAESLSLWVVASFAGVLLAYALIRLLIVNGPLALPRMDEVSLDATGLLVAFLGGLAVVIACGLVPALVAAKADAAVAFGTRNQSGPPRQRLQDLLVTAQIAGAMLLVVGAVLLARSFVRAQNEDPGYPSKNLIIVRLDLPRTTYPERSHLSAFYREARDRIGKLPGVVAVGGITDFFIRRNADQWVTVDGRPVEREAGTRLAIEGVTPGYFRGVGIEIVEGRDFDERDYEPGASGVFIVGETLARRFLAGRERGGQASRGRRAAAQGRPLVDRRRRCQGHAARGARCPSDTAGVHPRIPARDGHDDSCLDWRREPDTGGPSGDSSHRSDAARHADLHRR
jgi:putative ABC transport system permease protein